MNWIAVALGIVIIILFYVLFTNFTSTSKTLISSTANLMTQQPNITSINSPTSTRYAYGVWIYINTWNNNANKYIFARSNNISLYLDKTSPTLYCDVKMNDNTSTTLLITSNFPIQKWCQVIVSMDNQFADCYIDGKLVLSRKLDKLPLSPPDSSTPIVLGSNGSTGSYVPLDISIMSFQRWTEPVDPQSAWASYMSKSNSGSVANVFTSYGINMNILQDNVVKNTFRLY
jgi:hypothetical protein